LVYISHPIHTLAIRIGNMRKLKLENPAQLEADGNEGNLAKMPPRWKADYEAICQMREAKNAPVDTMSGEFLIDMTADPPIRRFQLLISLMLSSQTKDTITAVAMKRLRDYGLTIPSIRNCPETHLDQLIKKVGFHSRKAK
jgi:endonuclease-3